MFYFQVRVDQSDPFIHFHLPVLTMVLDHRKVIPYHTTIREPMYPSWVPQKHMPHLYPRHKQDQPITLLSRGLGPRPNLDSKPLLLSPGLSAAQGPPPSPPPINRSGKSRNPRQESNESSRSHNQVCAQDNKYVT